MELSTCHTANLYSRCAVDAGRSGLLNITTRLDPCSEPTMFGTLIESGENRWKNYFLSSNTHDSRLIGAEFWPILLHVFFVHEQGSPGDIAFQLKACLQVLKSDEWLCFMNETVPYSLLDSCADHNVEKSRILTACVSAIVLTVVLITLVSSGIVWRRRRQMDALMARKGGSDPESKHRPPDSPASLARPSQLRLPALPGSRPYTERSGKPPSGYSAAPRQDGETDGASTAILYAPLESSLITSASALEGHNLETKSVQTSTTSLDFGSRKSDTSGPSVGTSDGGSPGGTSSPHDLSGADEGPGVLAQDFHYKHLPNFIKVASRRGSGASGAGNGNHNTGSAEDARGGGNGTNQNVHGKYNSFSSGQLSPGHAPEQVAAASSGDVRVVGKGINSAKESSL